MYGKEKDWDPQGETRFLWLVKYHNSVVLPLLPGAPEGDEARFSEEELKEIILNAMPESSLTTELPTPTDF